MPRPRTRPRIQAAQDAHDATLETVARLCTEFGRVVERGAVRELLQQSADALSAAGLIVWLADDSGETLRPLLVHGYSDKILAQLPAVTRDADNATAAAFRTARPCEVAATAHTSGALVVPLLIPDGCAGVLAIELHQGVPHEPIASRRRCSCRRGADAAGVSLPPGRTAGAGRAGGARRGAVPSGGAADEGQALGGVLKAPARAARRADGRLGQKSTTRVCGSLRRPTSTSISAS